LSLSAWEKCTEKGTKASKGQRGRRKVARQSRSVREMVERNGGGGKEKKKRKEKKRPLHLDPCLSPFAFRLSPSPMPVTSIRGQSSPRCPPLMPLCLAVVLRDHGEACWRRCRDFGDSQRGSTADDQVARDQHPPPPTRLSSPKSQASNHKPQASTHTGTSLIKEQSLNSIIL
jgi:hypothetical protein